MAKIWEERRPGFHLYFDSIERTKLYGDVRAVSIDYEGPVDYKGQVYDPMPQGTQVGTFPTLAEAKAAVEQEAIVRSM